MESHLMPWRCSMIKYFVWVVFICILLLSPFIGAVNIDFSQLLEPHSLAWNIFFDLRIPRVLFAFFAGSILALGGLLFQTLFRNALMTPYTLGVSSGAILGAGIAMKLGLGTLLFGIAAISFFGFLGAILTVFLLIYLSQFLRANQQDSLLLLGIALSLFYTSALMIVFYLGSAMQNDMLIRFTMGSLSVIGWRDPIFLGLIAFIVFISIYAYKYELQLLSISEHQASLKGVNTKKITLWLLIFASLGIGVLVSISGPIGFVGLIVPHIVAKLYPSTVSHRIIKTALFGGLFLVFCDTLTRSLPTEGELPIGIMTALIGGPFFIYLIIAKAHK